MWFLEAMMRKNNKDVEMAKMLFSMYLMAHIGIPYKWGGDDPMEGFDCSGAVQEWLAYWGLDPKGDQTAHALFSHFWDDDENSTERGLGSLAFYGTPNKITHVAMMIDDERVIEFAGGGSNVRNYDDAVRENAFGRVRLLNNRNDLVAVIKPQGLPW